MITRVCKGVTIEFVDQPVSWVAASSGVGSRQALLMAASQSVIDVSCSTL
jgi:hypothetical protein